MPQPDPKTLAQEILDHEVIPAAGKKPTTSFSGQIAEDIKYSDLQHPEARNLLAALQAIAAGNTKPQEKNCFEIYALPVLEAYQKKSRRLQRENQPMAGGESLLAGLPAITDRQQVGSGGWVGNCGVAANNIGKIETKIRALAAIMNITLTEPAQTMSR